MTFAKYFLSIILIAMCASIAAAQAPAQPGPAKIGIIDSNLFADPTAGIKRLVTALKTLETEFKPKRDEITQLVSRFNTLQADAVKAPTAAKQEQLQTLQIEITRKQEDARVAYGKRNAALANPIRASVYTALEAFTKQRGVDVLIDMSKFPEGVLVANRGVDLTPAFIREYNSKNP
jgi:Skp family chaperone for outer membrane proteins